MAKRGRTAGFMMSDEHRLKIKNSNILSSLIKHVEGTQEMTSTQVTAGIALLKKVMPDAVAPKAGDDKDHPLTIQILSGVPRSGD